MPDEGLLMILKSVPIINYFITELHCSAAVSHRFLLHSIFESHSPRLWLNYNPTENWISLENVLNFFMTIVFLVGE